MAPRLQVAAAGAAVLSIAAYALASHWLMVHAADRPWAVAALFGPLLLGLAAAGWQQRQIPLLLACALGVAGLAWTVADGGVNGMNRLYVLQHAGLHIALGLGFGLTLRRGNTPLISALAQSLHTHFTPAMQAYTRWLTGAWTVYFFGMVAISGLVYLFAPWPWWSFFGNVLSPLCALLFALVEHQLRYLRHPDFERVRLLDVVGAYRRHARMKGSGAGVRS
jgi:uncharacterized membrane protein